MNKLTVISITTLFLISAFYLPNVSALDWDVYNTENIHRIPTNYSDNAFPDYSPDGKEIIYLSHAPVSKNPAIWIMNDDGTNRRVLYESMFLGLYGEHMKFSPDGNKICFLEYRDAGFAYEDKESSLNILIKNGSFWTSSKLEHKEIFKLKYALDGTILYISWSPEGKIMFTIGASDNGKNGLWLIDSDGSNLTQISRDETIRHPCFSPDGSKIIYTKLSYRDGFELWIMDSNGRNPHKILDGPWGFYQPRFTSDGRIIFASGMASLQTKTSESLSIWIMNSDGSGKTFLVPYEFDGGTHPSWMPVMSPDMKKLVFCHGSRYGMDYIKSSSYLYYVSDPTGEWKDSDGDGIWDGIDGAPNDPYMGYIGENPTMSQLMKMFVPIVFIVFIAVAAAAAFMVKKRKAGSSLPEETKEEKEE